MHILKFFEYFGGGTVKKAIAVVESGCDKGVNECFSSGLAECGAEAGNVTEMVESSFCDVVDMGFEGEGGVQDDTKVAEGVMVELSMLREKFPVERVRASGPMMIISDLLQFSLRTFCCIQFLIIVRQVVRVEWVLAVMALDGR